MLVYVRICSFISGNITLVRLGHVMSGYDRLYHVMWV